MINIERIVLREIRLPLKEPFRISSGVVTERRICFARARRRRRRDRRGRSASPASSRTTAPRRSTPRGLRSASGSRSSRDRPCVRCIHATCSRRLARECLRSQHGQSGDRDGHAGTSPPGRSNVPLSASCSVERAIASRPGSRSEFSRAPTHSSQRARAAVDAGYRKIKVKIQPGADVAYVRAVREALGPDVASHGRRELRLHARRRRPSRRARRVRPDHDRAAARRDDLVRHATLQVVCQTPICLDESITSVDRARGHDRVGQRAGSSTSSPGASADSRHRRRSTTCVSRAGIPVWCGGMLESGVGRAYNVALASLPNFTLPGDLSPERALLGPATSCAPSGRWTPRAWCTYRSAGRASASTSTWIGSTISPCADEDLGHALVAV